MLFLLKLYIGLSSNSISVYSDGINNLFDSLSGVLSFACLSGAAKLGGSYAKSVVSKTEQFLCLILSASLGIAGFVFAYSSLERLMYPTPIWFTLSYAQIIGASALVKLGMFCFFFKAEKKLGSGILKVMKMDSLLDFFITSATLVGFLISAKGSYSIDAFVGIGVSIVMIISAVKMLFEETKKLLNMPEKQKREALEESLCRLLGAETKIQTVFSVTDKTECFVKLQKHLENEEAIKEEILEKTGINIYFIKEN